MAPLRWFDTHVHLERYPAAEREAMVARAAAAGVAAMLCVSTTCDSSRRTAGLRPGLWKAVGVHPRSAGDGLCLEMDGLAMTDGVVAIGETGFDAEGPSFDVQEEVFRAQCNLARRLGLAVVLHIDGPGAWERLVGAADALEELRVVRHYFTGDAAQAAWHAQRGHYVSFGRPLQREQALRDVARGVPAEQLVIETDSYPVHGRETEPKDLGEVGRTLAHVRGWNLVECAERLWENSCRALRVDAEQERGRGPGGSR